MEYLPKSTPKKYIGIAHSPQIYPMRPEEWENLKQQEADRIGKDFFNLTPKPVFVLVKAYCDGAIK